MKDGEAWLFGAHITPLKTASTHIHPDATRTRKLLLHQAELNKLFGAVERKGYTVVPLTMFWKRGRAKLKSESQKGKQGIRQARHSKRTRLETRKRTAFTPKIRYN